MYISPLKPRNGIDIRTTANSIIIQKITKKTNSAILLYYYSVEHFVTMQIRGCNILLFPPCHTAQKSDLEVPLLSVLTGKCAKTVI